MDMLIRLYEQAPEAGVARAPDAGNARGPDAEGVSALEAAGAPRAPTRSAWVVRKPIGPEHDLVVAWIADRFGAGWASEARVALGNRPVSLWLAVESGTKTGTLLAFACYDATARGCVGPIGVAESARGRGVGAALLRACLLDMRSAGYGYAIAGDVGAPEFFRRVCGAVEIADSTPGLYAGRIAD